MFRASVQRIDELAGLGDDPAAPALIEAGRCLSYQALATAVGDATNLLSELGVRAGDRVLIVNENCAAALVLVFAAARSDAWPVLVNARLSVREIDAICAHCTPRRAFFTSESSREAAEHSVRLGGQPLSLDGVGEIAVTPRPAATNPEPVHGDPAKQIAMLLYTSGTTGQPKGVMLSHANLLFAARSGATLRRLGAGDRVYAALPISHVFGLASVSFSALLAGAALYLVPRFSAEGLARALAEEGISVLPGVPAMYARLLDYLRESGNALRAPRVRFLYAGGAPLDRELKAEVERVFEQPLHNGYGLTETSPTISSTRLDAPRTDLSVGPPVPGIEIRIAAADGRLAVADEVGELHIRGPNVMLGYYRAPALTAEVLGEDGWFNTGDLARLDAQGNLYIVGRSKEVIIRSGFNVYPMEVESVLNQHPSVSQSAVVGRQVAGNEEVVAYVELRAGAEVTADTLRAFTAERLAPYKRPAEIVVLPSLPATSTGKVLKSRLREMAEMKGACASKTDAPALGVTVQSRKTQ